jgi:hypothetical protein
MREHTVAGPSVTQKTPVCNVVFDMYKLARGDGINAPLAA